MLVPTTALTAGAADPFTAVSITKSRAMTGARCVASVTRSTQEKTFNCRSQGMTILSVLDLNPTAQSSEQSQN